MGGMALEGSVLASFLDEAPPFNFELLPPEPDLENFPSLSLLCFSSLKSALKALEKATLFIAVSTCYSQSWDWHGTYTV